MYLGTGSSPVNCTLESRRHLLLFVYATSQVAPICKLACIWGYLATAVIEHVVRDAATKHVVQDDAATHKVRDAAARHVVLRSIHKK